MTARTIISVPLCDHWLKCAFALLVYKSAFFIERISQESKNCRTFDMVLSKQYATIKGR